MTLKVCNVIVCECECVWLDEKPERVYAMGLCFGHLVHDMHT